MITYEKACPEQLQTVLKMRRECCACVFGKDESEFGGEFTRLSEEFFAHGDQTTVLAFDGGRAVGCATICYIMLMPTLDCPSGKRAHIMNVYVNAEHRRQGVARRMMNMLLGEAGERGVTYVSLDATEDGARLYKALGFEFSEENMGLNL
ncbi:MAG: GNAT family N-acetyltransferase [Lachnospiraceae bacterium]|nr:GNAT family N-acetyltransferase [Ruminococcus sp.]MCM1275161.1 GNAT family N-acetyltransferase [Lachnospiraceae bacterium]